MGCLLTLIYIKLHLHGCTWVHIKDLSLLKLIDQVVEAVLASYNLSQFIYTIWKLRMRSLAWLLKKAKSYRCGHNLIISNVLFQLSRVRFKMWGAYIQVMQFY